MFYEAYAGSITDVSQLRYMLNKAVGYGYNKAAFILDRGYFSKENIRFMDQNGYDFVIMAKGMKSLVRELVQQVKGSFEEDRSCSICSYQVSGTTVRHQLFPSDEQKRYFHVYYSAQKNASEREHFEQENEKFMYARERSEVISEDIRLYGRNLRISQGNRRRMIHDLFLRVNYIGS